MQIMSLNKILTFILTLNILDNYCVEMKIDNDFNFSKRENEMAKLIVSYLNIFFVTARFSRFFWPKNRA